MKWPPSPRNRDPSVSVVEVPAGRVEPSGVDQVASGDRRVDATDRSRRSDEQRREAAVEADHQPVVAGLARPSPGPGSTCSSLRASGFSTKTALPASQRPADEVGVRLACRVTTKTASMVGVARGRRRRRWSGVLEPELALRVDRRQRPGGRDRGQVGAVRGPPGAAAASTWRSCRRRRSRSAPVAARLSRPGVGAGAAELARAVRRAGSWRLVRRPRRGYSRRIPDALDNVPVAQLRVGLRRVLDRDGSPETRDPTSSWSPAIRSRKQPRLRRSVQRT